MKYIYKINENQNIVKLKSIDDLKYIKSGKDLDKEIKAILQFWLSDNFRTFIDDFIAEIKQGKTSSEMSDKYKDLYQLITRSFKQENPNKNGVDTLPQKIKKQWNENIVITRDLIILYLEDLKGQSSPNFRKPFDWTIKI